MERVKCLIIGSGPAGYTAAIYTSRAGLSPVLYSGLTPGGQLTETTEVDNFPGYPQGVLGTAMMDDIRRQAQRFGADIRQGEVTAVELGSRPFRVSIDGGAVGIEADSLIIATGATARYLGLPSERRFIGMGVSACAVCDGFFYRGRDVAVVGGGDSACEEALYLSTLCRRVWLVVRKPFLRASRHMQDRVFATANIEVLFEHTTDEVLGDENGVTGVRLLGPGAGAGSSGVSGVRGVDGVDGADGVSGVDGVSGAAGVSGVSGTAGSSGAAGAGDSEPGGVGGVGGAVRELPIEGFFLAIGHTPRTEIFRGQIDLDDDGYIVTGGGSGAVASGPDGSGTASTATSVPGVFAAGDVADRVYRQAITAAAAGCRAALDCERFLIG